MEVSTPYYCRGKLQLSLSFNSDVFKYRILCTSSPPTTPWFEKLISHQRLVAVFLMMLFKVYIAAYWKEKNSLARYESKKCGSILLGKNKMI
tara:strand:- start:220 stop:495 length:276 start_codon:yes stop_codon:yes gene_type:complete